MSAAGATHAAGVMMMAQDRNKYRAGTAETVGFRSQVGTNVSVINIRVKTDIDVIMETDTFVDEFSALVDWLQTFNLQTEVSKVFIKNIHTPALNFLRAAASVQNPTKQI